MTSGRATTETPFEGLRLSHVEAVEERHQSRVLRDLLRLFVALTLAIAFIGFGTGSFREGAIAALGAAVYGLLLLGRRRLGLRWTGALCTAWYFLLALGAMTLGRGVHDVTLVLLPSGILIGALLLPRRLLVPLVAVTITAVVGIGAAKISGLLPAAGEIPGLAEVFVAALLLLVAGVLTHLVVSSLEAMIEKRQRAERALIASRDELEARNEALQLVNEIAHRLQHSLDVAEIAREAVEVLVRHRRPPRVAFYLLEGGGERLRRVADHGFDEQLLALGATLPVDGSLSGVAVREREVVWSDDVDGDPRVEPEVGAALVESGIRSVLSVPLVFGDQVLGTINLHFHDRRTWTPLELDTFRGIGQAVSLALTNARHLAGLEHQAFHDPLTDLRNRASFHHDLPDLLASEGLTPASQALVLVDLKRFREINDALGHHVGDRVLTDLAARLSCRLENGGSRLFRLGGDEFVALLPGVADRADALARAQRLLAALDRPFEVDGMSLEVGAWAGVALFPEDGRDSHELLRCADVALYRAKRTETAVAAYAVEFDEHTPGRLALAAELGRAVREGGLELHFQPKVALADGRVIGFEALVRWPHPRLGLLAPAAFLPLAEASDLIHPLTFWVVENALVQLDRWQRERDGQGELTMAVNLSVRNLLDGNCAARIEEILGRVGVRPGQLELELTETAVMSDPEAAVTMLGRITATGARLAIDDFGTGYSSLAYLRRFPVHGIKIDRSFVAELGEGERSHAIIRSTLFLARSLGLRAVAEGVEDLRTADSLRELDCDLAQGFFFARPAPADELGPRLRASGWRLPAAEADAGSAPS